MINYDFKPVKIKPLTPIQRQYYKDNKHRFQLVTAGRRSRKTLIGKRKILLAAINNPGYRYFMAAPTYAQARNIFWDSGQPSYLKKDAYNFASNISESELTIELVNGSMIAVVGLDKPQRIEGVPWNGCLITEMADIKEGSWNTNIRPLLADTNGFALLDGTPNGLGEYYELACYAAGGVLPPVLPLFGAYSENPSNPNWAWYSWHSSDVLTAEEIYEIKSGPISAKEYRQEYEGSFEGNTSRVYDMFDRQLHVKDDIDISGMQIGAGVDFNVAEDTAMVAEIFAHNNDYIHFIDEIWLPKSNTYELANELAKQYCGTKVYPDPAGIARSASSETTSHQILRDKGFTVRVHKAHPSVKDRVNIFNGMLRNIEGKVRCTISKRCVHLIKDMEAVCWIMSATQKEDIDKRNPSITHASDAAGYAVEYLFGLKRKVFIGQIPI